MVLCDTMRISGWANGALNHFKEPADLRRIEELESLLGLRSKNFKPFYNEYETKMQHQLLKQKALW